MSPYNRATEYQAEDKLFDQATDLLFGDKVKLFDLSEVKDKEKKAYGEGNFANACLMASRLIHGGRLFRLTLEVGILIRIISRGQVI